MSTIIAFVLKYKVHLLIGIAAIVAVFLLLQGVSKIRTAIEDRRVAALEVQLKSAEERVQQLEGRRQILEVDLANVNGLLATANQGLADAQNATGKARVVYVNVGKGPVFNSTTDDGKVRELTEILDKLYP